MRAPAEPAAKAASYDPGLYENLVEVEDRHFWFQARNRAITAVFESLRAGLRPGYRVLEVGCGTGNVLRDLQRSALGGSVVGMDMHLEGLRYAQRRVNPALLVRADAGHPPFSVRFDVVGLFDVLEHLDDDVGVLRQLRELMSPGGALMLTVPAHGSLWSYFDVASRHRRRYELADLNEKLVAAGYSVEYITLYMAVLHPILWAGRRLTATRGRRTEDAAAAWSLAEADLRVRPVSGAVLGFLLKQELAWLRRRRPLPMGASLLAVARATA